MPENENTQGQQGDPAALGDAGKAALAAERKRADEAERARKDIEKQLADLQNQGLSDLEKARVEIDELKAAKTGLETTVNDLSLTVTRLNVGIDTGLSKPLIARLQGADEDAIKADAQSLKELIPGTNPFPKADPSQGDKGNQGATTNAQQFAEQLGDF